MRDIHRKVIQARKFMPGVEKKLAGDSSQYGDLHWYFGVQDLAFAKTSKYRIIAARWEQHHYEDGCGGIEWTDWLSLHYQGEEKIKNRTTEKIVIRDQYLPSKDKREFWGYKLSLKVLEDNLVEVAYVNTQGSRIKPYTFKLR